jgi:hypothetical protein
LIPLAVIVLIAAVGAAVVLTKAINQTLARIKTDGPEASV